MHEPPAIRDLSGDWRRSLLAFNDGRSDTTSFVRWLQGPSLFCDIRQAVSTPEVSAACLRALSIHDVVGLAAQEGFAGRLVRRGLTFEWIRWLDYQPPAGVEDRATLAWNREVLVETGYHTAYTEHWHRDEGRSGLSSAFHLRDQVVGGAAILVVASDRFAFGRERSAPLDAGQSLGDLVLDAPTLAAAQDLVDCEISYGPLNGWTIERSTLPWRVGTSLNVHREGTSIALDDIDPDGRTCRRSYDIIEQETA